MSGQRRVEAERQQRLSRPMRMVAIAIIALLLLGIVGSVIASSFDSSRGETVTVDGSGDNDTVDIPFSDGVPPVLAVGIVMAFVGIGLMARRFMWDIFWSRLPPRREGARGDDLVRSWVYRVGLTLFGLGIVVVLVSPVFD